MTEFVNEPYSETLELLLYTEGLVTQLYEKEEKGITHIRIRPSVINDWAVRAHDLLKARNKDHEFLPELNAISSLALKSTEEKFLIPLPQFKAATVGVLKHVSH